MSNTYADEADNVFKIYRDATYKTWDTRIRDSFINVADDATKKEIPNRIRVVRYADFNAFTNFSTHEIILPVGLISTLDFISDAAVITWVKPQCAEAFKKYYTFLAQTYAADYKSYENRTIYNAPDIRFETQCHLSSAEANNIRNNEQYYNVRIELLIDSLASILGHEIGHLVLKHLPSSELSAHQSQAQEYAADDFGFKLAAKAGFQPISVLSTTFPLFADMEGDLSSTFAKLSSHPPAECRIKRQMKYIIDFENNAPGAKAGLQHIGMSEEQFNKLLTELENICTNAGWN